MTRYDLSPLFRSTVGFDRLARMLDQLPQQSENTQAYPPYDIEALGEDRYKITIAVAGYRIDDISIQQHENLLTVNGHLPDQNTAKVYLYRGLNNVSFERKFQLDDYVEVKNASLYDGLLRIELVREVPEEMKPRKIAIRQVSESDDLDRNSQKMIEGNKAKAA